MRRSEAAELVHRIQELPERFENPRMRGLIFCSVQFTDKQLSRSYRIRNGVDIQIWNYASVSNIAARFDFLVHHAFPAQREAK